MFNELCLLCCLHGFPGWACRSLSVPLWCLFLSSFALHTHDLTTHHAHAWLQVLQSQGGLSALQQKQLQAEKFTVKQQA